MNLRHCNKEHLIFFYGVTFALLIYPRTKSSIGTQSPQLSKLKKGGEGNLLTEWQRTRPKSKRTHSKRGSGDKPLHFRRQDHQKQCKQKPKHNTATTTPPATTRTATKTPNNDANNKRQTTTTTNDERQTTNDERRTTTTTNEGTNDNDDGVTKPNNETKRQPHSLTHSLTHSTLSPSLTHCQPHNATQRTHHNIVMPSKCTACYDNALE